MAAVLGGLVGVTAAAADAQFLPVLGAHEGAQRALQIPLTNGFIDYVTLLNERAGSIRGGAGRGGGHGLYLHDLAWHGDPLPAHPGGPDLADYPLVPRS